MKLEIIPHPEEVIDVDPEIIVLMKFRLAQPQTTIIEKMPLVERDN